MRAPSDLEVRAFLRRLRSVVDRRLEGDVSAVLVTRHALTGAEDDLGWSLVELVSFLSTLVLEDFHRRERSTGGTGVVWTFEPYVSEDLIWLRIVEDNSSWRVISCHLSEVTGEAPIGEPDLDDEH